MRKPHFVKVVDNPLSLPNQRLMWVFSRPRRETVGIVEYSSLSEVLTAADKKGHALFLTLSTGHQLLLTLQAVGVDWISGYPPETQGSGYVIRLAAVVSIVGCDSAPFDVPQHEMTRKAPLQALLAVCATRKEAVVVHSAQHSRRGQIVSAGPDWLRIHRPGGGEEVLPYASIAWLEIGSDA